MFKAINIYQFKDIENMYSPLNELANFTNFFYGTSLSEEQLKKFVKFANSFKGEYIFSISLN